MQDLKLVGLKSHDCHIIMQQLLPVAIRGILPKITHKSNTKKFRENKIFQKYQTDFAQKMNLS